MIFKYCRIAGACFVTFVNQLMLFLSKENFLGECIIGTCLDKQNCKKWVAAVSWFEPHQCKVWFGYPTEVWSTISFENQFFKFAKY